jgi:hypothetical protein
MTARLHPGGLVHVWDHLVIGLRDAVGPTCSLSLYAVAYSGELGGGHVCLLDIRDRPRVVLAEPVELGQRMQTRLRRMSAPGTATIVAVEPAAFVRHPATTDRLRWTVEGQDTRVEARWEALEAPFWAEGRAPAFWAEEDIWACFVAAGSATVSVDGERMPGSPYDDPAWVPKLGRSLSSAHAALAEVRVTPAGERAPAAGG